jgi:stress response protein YsnF
MALKGANTDQILADSFQELLVTTHSALKQLKAIPSTEMTKEQRDKKSILKAMHKVLAANTSALTVQRAEPAVLARAQPAPAAVLAAARQVIGEQRRNENAPKQEGGNVKALQNRLGLAFHGGVNQAPQVGVQKAIRNEAAPVVVPAKRAAVIAPVPATPVVVAHKAPYPQTAPVVAPQYQLGVNARAAAGNLFKKAPVVDKAKAELAQRKLQNAANKAKEQAPCVLGNLDNALQAQALKLKKAKKN